MATYQNGDDDDDKICDDDGDDDDDEDNCDDDGDELGTRPPSFVSTSDQFEIRRCPDQWPPAHN